MSNGLTKEEESFLPCKSLEAVFYLRKRGYSLCEARSIVKSHPKYKDIDDLYIDVCPFCGSRVSFEGDGVFCADCKKEITNDI